MIHGRSHNNFDCFGLSVTMTYFLSHVDARGCTVLQRSRWLVAGIL